MRHERTIANPLFERETALWGRCPHCQRNGSHRAELLPNDKGHWSICVYCDGRFTNTENSTGWTKERLDEWLEEHRLKTTWQYKLKDCLARFSQRTKKQFLSVVRK